MNRSKMARIQTLARPKGAALIAVLLLSMVLSAVGIVAMQNTFSSLQLSGNYRMRTQAEETADSAMSFYSMRCGNQPVNCLGRLKASRTLDPTKDGLITTHEEMLTSAVIPAPPIAGETGLFSGTAASLASHESDASLGQASFSVVLRDPSEGPPPPGSDGAFCSRKVYLGSRASYSSLELNGNVQRVENWERPPRAAAGMVGVEAWIGPVPCNGGGSR